MSLHLSEMGIEHRRVFMDTGWEHTSTYEYLRGPLTDKLGPIEEISAGFGMKDLIRKKGMFPSRLIRFCTQELKVLPIIRYLKGLDDEPVNAVGIRAEESQARAKMKEWEWQDGFDCEVWRPLLRWTLDDVIAIHKRHALMPSNLYLQGASRIGCWPCIHARKKEIKFVAEHDPARIEEIAELERENGYTYFQGKHKRLPIHEVVEWSRTARGSDQFEMFDASNDMSGCMRWGMCDLDV